VLYVQGGLLKALHQDAAGTIEPYELFADTEVPKNVHGLLDNTSSGSQLSVAVGEYSEGSSLFCIIVDDGKCIIKRIITGSVSNISNIQFVNSDIFFVQDESLCRLSYETIARNDNLASEKVISDKVDIYNIFYDYTTKNYYGYYATKNAAEYGVRFFVLVDQKAVVSQSYTYNSLPDVSCSLLPDKGYLFICDNGIESMTVQFVDSSFLLINRDRGVVSYPFISYGEFDQSKQINIVRNNDEVEARFGSNADKIIDLDKYLYIPISNNIVLFISTLANTWNYAAIDFSNFAAEQKVPLSIESTARLLNVVTTEDSLVLFFAEENTIREVSINKTTYNVSYRSYANYYENSFVFKDAHSSFPWCDCTYVTKKICVYPVAGGFLLLDTNSGLISLESAKLYAVSKQRDNVTYLAFLDADIVGLSLFEDE
jgi:hypothetical protein